jgi:hypothetical protein
MHNRLHASEMHDARLCFDLQRRDRLGRLDLDHDWLGGDDAIGLGQAVAPGRSGSGAHPRGEGNAKGHDEQPSDQPQPSSPYIADAFGDPIHAGNAG